MHLTKAIYEVRYPGAGHVLWDRAGQLVRELMGQRPDLEVLQAQPAQVQMMLREQELTVDMRLDLFVIAQELLDGEPQRVFLEICRLVTASITGTLELRTFQRTAVRSHWLQPTDTVRDAVQLARNAGWLAPAPDGAARGDDLPSYSSVSHAWGEGELTTVLRLAPLEETTLGVVPKRLRQGRSGSVEVKRVGLVADIDSFIERPMDTARFNAEEFVQERIRRGRELAERTCGGMRR